MSLIDSPVESADVGYRGDARERALVDVASVLASHAGIAELLASLRGQLEPLVPFAYLAIGLRDADGDTLGLRLISIRPGVVEEIPGESCPLDGSYTGLVVRNGEPVYLPRVQSGGLPPSDTCIVRAEQIARGDWKVRRRTKALLENVGWPPAPRAGRTRTSEG